MTAQLPWQRTGLKGSYDRDRMSLDVSSPDAPLVLLCRKQRPGEIQPGFYVGYVNDERISNNKHEFMRDALAEAEAYFYGLAQFSKAGASIIQEAIRTQGRMSYAEGTTIIDGIRSQSAENVAQWVMGWLDGFAGKIAESTLATARANSILEADNNGLSARMEALTTVFEFAILQSDRAAQFLRDVLRNDPALMADEWPNWASYLESKRAK